MITQIQVKKSKLYLITLTLSIITVSVCSFKSKAVTISASKDGNATIRITQTNAGSSPDWRFRIFNSAGVSSLSKSYATVTWACSADTSQTFSTTLSPEVKTTNIGNNGGPCTSVWVRARAANYVLNNSSTQPITTQVSIYNYNDSNDALATTMTVPASSSCSVDVNVAPKIATLNPGDTVNEVNVTSNATGSGIMIFKADAYDVNGGKLVKGSDSLTYNVTDTTWDSTTGQWSGNLGLHGVKLNNIPDNAPSGTYNGSMTATISCL